MDKNIKVIAEDKDSFTAMLDGKEIKLYKINIDEIEIKRRTDLYKAAGHIPKELIVNALYLTSRTLDKIPTVDDYEDIATIAVDYMNQIYKYLRKNKLSYIIHYLIKNTDPYIYGRAQTFMKNIRYFDTDLRIIQDFQVDMTIKP